MSRDTGVHHETGIADDIGDVERERERRGIKTRKSRRDGISTPGVPGRPLPLVLDADFPIRMVKYLEAMRAADCGRVRDSINSTRGKELLVS